MSFTEDFKNLVNDLYQRKEFRGFIRRHLHKNVEPIPGVIPDKFVTEGYNLNKVVEFTNHGFFVQNFLNPNTPYNRLLLKWSTGVGKTIGSLSIARNFINEIKRRELNGVPKDKSGTIIIVGFSYDIFKRELLSFPQFGIVSREEITTRNRLFSLAAKNSRYEQQARSIYVKQKQKLGNKKGYGYFRFMGYITFFHYVFRFSDEYIKNHTNLHELNIVHFNRQEINEMLNKGYVKINENAINMLRNSMLIFDEIHKVYNAMTMNNWGFAIELILRKMRDVRVVFLSATPITHSPTEIVELLKLLNSDNNKVVPPKHELFDNHTLRKGAEKKIANLCTGRISFIKDSNPNFYAERVFHGEYLGKQRLLRFKRCKMTGMQMIAYKLFVQRKIMRTSTSIFDIVFPPLPKSRIPIIDFKKCIQYAAKNTTWGVNNGIQVKQEHVHGSFFNVKSLKKYSGKYYWLIKKLLDCVRNRAGKCFIYHDFVQSSGTNLIDLILNENGFIPYTNTRRVYFTPNVLCTCGRRYKEHSSSKKSKHKFTPCCVIKITGQLIQSHRNRLVRLFNHQSNTNGQKAMILLGSRIISESYSLSAVRNVFVVSRPFNIPTLIQIVGRAVRKNAHNALEPKHRIVKIYVMTASARSRMSYEERMYLLKLHHYHTVQKIERIMHINAIDAARSLYKQKEIEILRKRRGFPLKSSRDITSFLQYTPKVKKWPITKLQTITFNSYFFQNEFTITSFVIKKLFLNTSHVWKFSDLVAAIRDPPFDVNYDTRIISKQTIILILNKLTYQRGFKQKQMFQEARSIMLFNQDIGHNSVGTGQMLFLNAGNQLDSAKHDYEKQRVASEVLDRLIDPKSILMYLPEFNIYVVIVQLGEWFFLCSLDIKQMVPMIFTDCNNRFASGQYLKQIDITKIIQEVQKLPSTMKHKQSIFTTKLTNLPFQKLILLIDQFDFQFHRNIIQSLIQWAQGIMNGAPKKSDAVTKTNCKLLCLYRLFDLVMFASDLNPGLWSTFKYMYKDKVRPHQSKVFSDFCSEWLYDESFLSQPLVAGFPKQQIDKVSAYLSKSIAFFKKPNLEDMHKYLPLGHFLLTNPQILRKGKWTFLNPVFFAPTVQTKRNKYQVQNFDLIGYDMFDPSSMKFSFKLKSKSKVIKSTDRRMRIKGMDCTSENKKNVSDIWIKLLKQPKRNLKQKQICKYIRFFLRLKQTTQTNQIQKPGTKYYYFFKHYQLGALTR